MLPARCACGFTELDDEQVADHLALVFVPDDSIGKDGMTHEELLSLACSCGYAGTTPEEVEGHLMAAFTPADRIGLDGKRHEARATA
jgi:hypothetical protein